MCDTLIVLVACGMFVSIKFDQIGRFTTQSTIVSSSSRNNKIKENCLSNMISKPTNLIHFIVNQLICLRAEYGHLIQCFVVAADSAVVVAHIERTMKSNWITTRKLTINIDFCILFTFCAFLNVQCAIYTTFSCRQTMTKELYSMCIVIADVHP